MSSECRGVIEIGTNSVKLLLGEVSGRSVNPVHSANEITRLGQGLTRLGRLQPEAITRTARVVSDFVKQARTRQLSSLRIITTWAGRSAPNAAQLMEEVEQRTQMKVEVITGEQEASWAFRGVTSDPAMVGEPLLIVDVGGGSTEFILGENDTIHYWRSLTLGSLRLLELVDISDPPTAAELSRCRAWLEDFLDRNVRPELEEALKAVGTRKIRLVGTGGNAAVLGRICPRLGLRPVEKSEAIKMVRLQNVMEWLWGMSLTERLDLDGLPRKRADLILTGGSAFAEIMEHFGFEELTISRRGVRYGALLDGVEAKEPLHDLSTSPSGEGVPSPVPCQGEKQARDAIALT